MVSLSAVFIGFHETFYENDALRLGMRIHRLRRVHSHSQRRGIWLICNGRACECVHTCRVAHVSCRVQLLMPHVQCQDVRDAIVHWEMNWTEGPPGIVRCLSYFINMTVKHNNLWNPIIGCLYVNFVGLHVSVIHMTIIRSVRAKEIAMQQRFPECNGIPSCFTLFSKIDTEL
jgi:hypothetical protein